MNGLWTNATEAEAILILSDKTDVPKNRRYYHVHQNFELVELGGVRRIRKKRSAKIMATTESFEHIIRDVHEAINHKGETKTHKKIQEHYANIPKMAVRRYIANCERCVEKKCTRSVVVRPILDSALNDRGQVDLVDYQSLPDGEFRYILHYEEHFTKYSFFRPLTSKKAVEVAKELLQIFLNFGAPRVLQSDNDRELTAGIIRELASLWPELVLVNGRPRHPQSQGSVQRGNGPLKDALVAWMKDNQTTKWSEGLPFVQWGMNCTYHEAIKMTPYEAMFGQKSRIGLTTSLQHEFLENISPGIEEEDFETLLSAAGDISDTDLQDDVLSNEGPSRKKRILDSQKNVKCEVENMDVCSTFQIDEKMVATEIPEMKYPATVAREEAVKNLEAQAERMLRRG